jgi:hypothetical protein
MEELPGRRAGTAPVILGYSVNDRVLGETLKEI